MIVSYSPLLDFARKDDAQEYIVVTESGILFDMQRECPEKTFIPAPADDAECQCNECDFMKMITLEKLRDCLRDGKPEIIVEPEIAKKAIRPIERMLALS